MCKPATTTTTTQQPSSLEEKASLSTWKSWTAQRQAKIDALNDRVAKLTIQAQKTSQASGKPLSLEYIHAQQKMTTLVAGAPVYQLRSAWIVYAYCIFAAVLVSVGVYQTGSLPVSLVSLFMAFVGYDLYSGILHVVFDHPSNIALPVLGQPCLEFQWHHAIPDDGVRRDFVDVCGDLNMAIAILVVVNLCMLDLGSGVALTLGGLKLGMAYFGQFSHRSAHTFGPSRALAAQWLQTNGFMISPKEHMAHHKQPHDIDFCLIGLCNPIIDAMRLVTTNNYIWLSTLLIWSMFDLVCCTYIVEALSKLVAGMI